MFYRFQKRRRKQRLNRAIGGILDTPPMPAEPTPRCIASMLANRGVTMHTLSLKSFRTKLGRGKVAAIIDCDMPPSLRELEDIARDPRRRGGTRNLYVPDRSESGRQTNSMRCHPIHNVRWLRPSDGFDLMSLPEVAEATRSDYRWAFWSQPVERRCVSWQQTIPLHRAHSPSSGHASLAALADHTLSRPSPERG
jgi:hypothetical protein